MNPNLKHPLFFQKTLHKSHYSTVPCCSWKLLDSNLNWLMVCIICNQQLAMEQRLPFRVNLARPPLTFAYWTLLSLEKGKTELCIQCTGVHNLTECSAVLQRTLENTVPDVVHCKINLQWKAGALLCNSSTFYSVAHCTLHIAHCTLHTAHCTLHIAHCNAMQLMFESVATPLSSLWQIFLFNVPTLLVHSNL